MNGESFRSNDGERVDFSREEEGILGRNVLNSMSFLEGFDVKSAFDPLDGEAEMLEDLDEMAEVTGDKEILWTVEDIRGYFADRTADNLELLKEKKSKLANVYQSLCEEYPDLKCVKLEDSSEYADKIDGKGCSFSSDRPGARLPIVEFDLSSSKGSEDNLSRKVWMETIANGLGVSYNEMASNQSLFDVVVFLHEFGHAHDFLSNAMGYNGVNNEDFLSGWETLTFLDGGESFEAVFEVERLKREHNEGMLPTEVEYFADTARYGTYEDFQRLQAQKYREMEDEKYADDFAIKYVLEHMDKVAD